MSGQVIRVEMSNLALSDTVIYEAMGYGDVVPDDETSALTRDLLEQAMGVVHPMFYYNIFPCEINANGVSVANCNFETNKTITALMRNSQRVALFVATAGAEFQQWLDTISQSGDALSMFVLDAIGSSAVEAVGDYMEQILQSEIGATGHTNRFSPGYCGWDICEQQKLFSLLPSGVCSVELSINSLMSPMKSISGIVGIGDDVVTRKYGCSICNNKSCYLRKN
ncbi:MAG: vitamin B12 dependent-methionine synthase activation domain-containing protein [Rikenellaceae bacterium]